MTRWVGVSATCVLKPTRIVVSCDPDILPRKTSGVRKTGSFAPRRQAFTAGESRHLNMVWAYFLTYASRQTDRRTDRQTYEYTDRNISRPVALGPCRVTYSAKSFRCYSNNCSSNSASAAAAASVKRWIKLVLRQLTNWRHHFVHRIQRRSIRACKR